MAKDKGESLTVHSDALAPLPWPPLTRSEFAPLRAHAFELGYRYADEQSQTAILPCR